MYVRVSVCARCHVCLHACVCLHARAPIHVACVYVSLCVYMRVCVLVRSHVCVYMHAYLYMLHACMCACALPYGVYEHVGTPKYTRWYTSTYVRHIHVRAFVLGYITSIHV